MSSIVKEKATNKTKNMILIAEGLSLWKSVFQMKNNLSDDAQILMYHCGFFQVKSIFPIIPNLCYLPSIILRCFIFKVT